MRLIQLLLAVALVAIAAGRADAYPQFQLSTGNDTCKQCHYSPGGGGLINDYGRDEAGSTLSWKEGNGGFLHGKWTPPEKVPLGGDFRLAGGYRNTADAICTTPPAAPSCESFSEPFVFPMQMELYARPKIGPVALYINAGLRDHRTYIGPGSREHYLMYEPEGADWYVRAGRFFPVFGLRSQDHTQYIRRHLQMYVYEEPYGVAYGRYFASSELHLSAFVRSPDVLGTARDNGVAVYYEKRNAETTAAYAAQARFTISDTDRRAWIGGVYKRWMEGPKLLFMGELDLGPQAFPDTDVRHRIQMVGHLGVERTLGQGLLLGATVQAFDPDITVEEAASREAAELTLQWFPIPHTELHLLARYEMLGWDSGAPILLVLSQLHYYL